MQINVKSTRANPSASHPHRAHKKLRFGTAKVGRTTVSSQWLRANGWMTKLRGKPPYKFLHRKNVTFPSKNGKRGKTGKVSKPKKRSMSQAAKKAWATRRRRHH